MRRKTRETDVTVVIGGEKVEIDTGVKFLDHMLETFAKFSGMNLVVKASGDLEHHLMEDVAICLGEEISKIEKRGIRRFGDAIVPMDDAVAICGLDFSGRGYLVVEGELGDGEVKECNFIHFFDTLCRKGGINIYVQVKGKNPHHKMEAMVKAISLAFRKALEKVGEDYFSLKGIL
ncbi:MAG: imidazoleglycerol-phosphate dehydratase [Archaeoglobaceae archaeon]|nr:imidazoleglycerol-phosphate dehydratase [Archaeoglobaceae archaeon]MCX8151854.1 imidazoleglycerol-phosphate dehydratase [Archaeoglobaceae archaeon]MDW8014314.1 imidazoleglycerol-phosphate dehydratase [Archaeoglobaceae archaeon]